MNNRLDLSGIQWRRVSPKYVIVDIIAAVVVTLALLVAASIPVFVNHVLLWWLLPAAVLVIMLIVIAFIPRRVRAIGYQLRDDDLLFRRGLLFQRFVSVPYGRMQLVDITRGPVSRVLGLSDLHFVTAAASSGVMIPGLLVADAEELRDHLVSVAETRRAGL
ncbi:MAG TPA: PH domain-containing protein [Galbitalea sp.]|nr:PH domain-containing protein [Galbitalea sp.]